MVQSLLKIGLPVTTDIYIESLIHIGQLAIKAQELREVAEIARREFAESVRGCIDFQKSDESHTAWLFFRLSGDDPVSGERKTRWLDAEGNDASNRPEVIRNQNAYRDMRKATRSAGRAKASLTLAIKMHVKRDAELMS